MPNPTPSPALAVDAIELCIALADDRATCADALCARKGECQYPSDCPYSDPLGRNAKAQLTALQQALADAQKDTERLETIREAAHEVTMLVGTEIERIIREHTGLHNLITVGYWTYGYRELSMHEKLDPKTCVGHTTIGALLNLKRLAARTPDPAGEDEKNGQD